MFPVVCLYPVPSSSVEISQQNAAMADQHEKPKADDVRERKEILTFKDLSAGNAEVIIMHEGREYRLRATRNGKLILSR